MKNEKTYVSYEDLAASLEKEENAKNITPSVENLIYNTPKVLIKNTSKVNTKDERYEIEFSKEFQPQYFNRATQIKAGYNTYSNEHPNKFISIEQFEKTIFYYVANSTYVKEEKINNEIVNKAFNIYFSEIFYFFMRDIESTVKDMTTDPEYTNKILKSTLTFNK